MTDRLPSSRDPRLRTPAEVAQLVRTSRKVRRWSQEALAAEAIVTRRTVQRIEAGEPSDLQTRRGVACVLGLPEAWLTEPHVWLTDNEFAEGHRRMREEASKTHHVLPARRLDGQALATLLAGTDSLGHGEAASVELTREQREAWAGFLDYVRDAGDIMEDLSQDDRLRTADDLAEQLEVLAKVGVTVVAASRSARLRVSGAGEGIPVTEPCCTDRR